MLHTPFSVAMSFSSPDGKGIYVLPTSDEAPTGWGEPRWQPATKDTPAQAIVPGTVGGSFPVTLIREKSGGWKAASLKQFQYGGNITWYGDWRNPTKQAKGKVTLSYAGPKLRYFRDDTFNYGDSPKHNEVYYLGSIAAVAPGPVLGACVRKISWYNPKTQKAEDTQFMIVAVYKDDKDMFYRRIWKNTTVRPDKLTDAVREAAMQEYDAEDSPEGWMPMGVVAKVDNAYRAETPWFFNKSGTAAVTMRRKNLTFNNGNVDVTEDFYNRYKVTISDSSVSFSNASNADPMQYKEKLTKEQNKGYISTDHMGYTHTWDEDIVKVSITLKGEHYVMCDYKEDTLIYGKVKFDMLRVQEEYYTKGVDAADYKNAEDQNISNQSYARYYGPYYFDALRYGYYDPAYVVSIADHNWTTWINVSETITFYYGPEGSEETNSVELHQYDSGTSDEWAGNPRQKNNPYLYFYYFSTRWFQGFTDFRQYMGFLAYDFTKYSLNRSGSLYDRTEKHKTTLYSDANTKGDDQQSIKKANTCNISFGWTRSDMESWTATFSTELARTTYIGVWPDDNTSGAKQKPGSRTFYAGDGSGDVVKDWPTIPKLLCGDNNLCKGNGVVTDMGKIAYSVEVPDVNTEGKYLPLSALYTVGKMESIVGFGSKFYPVGTC